MKNRLGINRPHQDDIKKWQSLTSTTNKELAQIRELCYSKIDQNTDSVSQMAHVAWNSLEIKKTNVVASIGNGFFVMDMEALFEQSDSICTDSTYKILCKELVIKNCIAPECITDREQKYIRALACAVPTTSFVIYVAENVRVIDPILIPLGSDKGLDIQQGVIIVESGAHVSLADVLSSLQQKTKVVIRALDIYVRANARLDFLYDQNWQKTTIGFNSITVYVDAGAHIQFMQLHTGGAFFDEMHTILLDGEKGVVYVQAVALLCQDQRINITSMQRHNGRGTVSNLRVRSIVADTASSYADGTVHVANNADSASAHQETKQMLLNDTASAYVVPRLEALANNIECTHGNAIGQIDKNQLLYAQARGIDLVRAQEILIKGFLYTAFFKELSPSIKSRYENRIDDWLSNRIT